jgi:hypothetical protein
MLACALALVVALGQFGQANTGELRVTVTDTTGAALPGPVEVTSQANEVRQQVDTDATGVAVVRRLPFGSYQVVVKRSGFADASQVVEVRSALPTDFRVTMNVSAVQTQTTVTCGFHSARSAPGDPGASHRIRDASATHHGTAGPSLARSREYAAGWLLEANGILHPRGSEYQTQYVVDGLPMTDNRSPVFAPEAGADGIHSMTIMTGGYPAEYGRKLGRRHRSRDRGVGATGFWQFRVRICREL